MSQMEGWPPRCSPSLSSAVRHRALRTLPTYHRRRRVTSRRPHLRTLASSVLLDVVHFPPQERSQVRSTAQQVAGRYGAGLWMPTHRERESKIRVWRLDNSSLKESPSLIMTGPAGQVGQLSWGPVEHGQSSWAGPGREFGTGLLFPTAGCWDIRVTLGQLTGHTYVVVT
jgi:hypothetical protein